jgi:hypothetical protein
MSGRSGKRVRKGIQVVRLDPNTLSGCGDGSLASVCSGIFQNTYGFGAGRWTI